MQGCLQDNPWKRANVGEKVFKTSWCWLAAGAAGRKILSMDKLQAWPLIGEVQQWNLRPRNVSNEAQLTLGVASNFTNQQNVNGRSSQWSCGIQMSRSLALVAPVSFLIRPAYWSAASWPSIFMAVNLSPLRFCFPIVLTVLVGSYW